MAVGKTEGNKKKKERIKKTKIKKTSPKGKKIKASERR